MENLKEENQTKENVREQDNNRTEEDHRAKNIKDLAKRAKGRLSNGFWSEYRINLEELTADEQRIIEKSEILNYFRAKAANELRNDKEERFYEKVKYILDTEGDVCNIIARLCDDEEMARLDCIARERYVFETSNRYLECRERYEKEKYYEETLKSRMSAVELKIFKKIR